MERRLIRSCAINPFHPPKRICPTFTSGGRNHAIKGLFPPLTLIDRAIREPNAIYLAEKCIEKSTTCCCFPRKQPSIQAQVSGCNNALAMPFQAADPKTEETTAPQSLSFNKALRLLCT